MAEKIDTLYVFGIGGTGERVMRSLIMAVAGGMEMNCNVIQPVLIDSDQKSWALKQAVDLINAYNKIKTFHKLEGDYAEKDQMVKKNSMFHVMVNPPILMNMSGTQAESLFSLVNAKSFKENSPNLDAEFNALYSEKSQKMDLSWGFVGNPSIGAVVLNQMFQNPEYKQKLDCITSKDAVFVAGSIFGGTGAAGIPLLVNLIRDRFKTDCKGLRVGALAVFPYFNLFEVDDESAEAKALENYDVNCNEFSTKSIAALSYYDKYLHALSSMYYLGTGDPTKRSLFPKCKGGDKQNNPASLLELLGAQAISHFTWNAQEMTQEVARNQFDRFTQYYDYFLPDKSNDFYYDLRHLTYDNPKCDIQKPLVRLQLFHYIWEKCAKGWVETEGNQWKTMAQMDLTKFNNFKKSTLGDFLSGFAQWQKELTGDVLDGKNVHKGAFPFKFFDVAEEKAENQNDITRHFKPSVAYVSNGFFSKNKVADPGILEKMQTLKVSHSSDSFTDDGARFRYALYTSLYAIEHIVNDENCTTFKFAKL